MTKTRHREFSTLGMLIGCMFACYVLCGLVYFLVDREIDRQLFEGPPCAKDYSNGMTPSEAAALVGIPIVEFEPLPDQFDPVPEVSMEEYYLDPGRRCAINLSYTARPNIHPQITMNVTISHPLSRAEEVRGTLVPATQRPDFWNCEENNEPNSKDFPIRCYGRLNNFPISVWSPYQMEDTEALLSSLRLVY